MVRFRWLKISSIIVENCLYEYEIRGKIELKVFCTDLMNFVHIPYRCGPLRVGMYGLYTSEINVGYI